jgi:hypothetical protein
MVYERRGSSGLSYSLASFSDSLLDYLVVAGLEVPFWLLGSTEHYDFTVEVS